MATHKTPPRPLSTEDQSPVPPTTGFIRSPRPECLRAAVFWDLTDRRHYPPSPGTGLALISPILYPYVPSPTSPDIERNYPQLMTLDGTNDPKEPTNDNTNQNNNETHHETGYPVTSSPTFKKSTRTLKNQANDSHLAYHLDALDLDADTRNPYHLSAKHLDRKAKIKNSKTIDRFKFPRSPPHVGRVQKKKKNKLDMYQHSKHAGLDAEKKKTQVAKILHGRCDERTRGLEDPFTSC